MKPFENDQEKLELLKKYKLAAKTDTEFPTLYYFKVGCDTPITCEVIGYEKIFDTWAIITINADGKAVNIHSDYLADMKAKGRKYFRESEPVPVIASDPNAYVVFDLETTGRNYKKDEIIEISALKCTNNSIYEFSELVYTDEIIPLNVTSLTGIDNSMLSNADPIAKVLPRFLAFIGDCKLVGHNIKSFDILFINKACHDLGLPEVKNEIVDTLKLSRNVLPNLESHTLSAICDYYGVDNSGAHRALADCYMCHDCYNYLTGTDSPDTNEITDPNKANTLFQAKLLDILHSTISELELPPNGLILKGNGGQKVVTSSVYINEPPYPFTESDLSKINSTQSILKFEETESSIVLSIKKSTFEAVPYPSGIKTKNNGKVFVNVYFTPNDPAVYTYTQKIIYHRIRTYVSSANTFGCCSKFVECSDAMKCVHENKLYSTACTYRKHLENGRIFYGKNRNVD